MFAKAGTRITPMLFVDDEYIGGWEEVAELDEAGQFERIMEY
jgi:glutaredoxin-related protein